MLDIRNYPPMRPRQHLRAYDLVRRECCNYDDGMCIVLENGYGDACVQCISHSVMCRWFRDAVLPLDAGLDDKRDRSKCHLGKQVTFGPVPFVISIHSLLSPEEQRHSPGAGVGTDRGADGEDLNLSFHFGEALLDERLHRLRIRGAGGLGDVAGLVVL